MFSTKEKKWGYAFINVVSINRLSEAAVKKFKDNSPSTLPEFSFFERTVDG